MDPSGRASLPGSVQTPHGHRVQPEAWPYLPWSSQSSCSRVFRLALLPAAGARERGWGRAQAQGRARRRLGAGQRGTPEPRFPGGRWPSGPHQVTHEGCRASVWKVCES